MKLYWPTFIQYYKIINKNNAHGIDNIAIIIGNDYALSKYRCRIRHQDLETLKALEFNFK